VIVNGVREIISSADLHGEAHDAYVSISRYMDEKSKELGNLFDDWRRSTAFTTLMFWAKAGIITEDEFMAFSEETKAIINEIVDVKFFKREDDKA
jgi:hypothetical protein